MVIVDFFNTYIRDDNLLGTFERLQHMYTPQTPQDVDPNLRLNHQDSYSFILLVMNVDGI